MAGFLASANALVKVQLLTTDDNEMPTHLSMKELAELTMESLTDCRAVMDQLLGRLDSDSAYSRVKALKIIKHLAQRGRPEFQMEIQRKTDPIRSCQSTRMVMCPEGHTTRITHT